MIVCYISILVLKQIHASLISFHNKLNLVKMLVLEVLHLLALTDIDHAALLFEHDALGGMVDLCLDGTIHDQFTDLLDSFSLGHGELGLDIWD